MKRVKLIVAYDGTNYCGWQMQPNGITIEEVLNRELSRLMKEPIAVIGASRTDSGVHAWGNIAVFDTHARMPADKICIALNQRLPKDIVVQSSMEVPADWHPRKCNSRKTYEYRILNCAVPFPAERFNSYFYYYPLDVEKMQKAADNLVGEHDFKSFCSIRTQIEDTVRRIYEIKVTKTADRIDIRIRGNGFLYNMVRIIVGSLIKVGCGFWEAERMKEVLEARDRSQAGPTAPAEGLTLVSIEEEQTLEPIVTEKNEHWSYKVIQREIVSKKKAYIFILECEARDYEALLLRLVKQASRNGAEAVFVCDRTNRLYQGKKAEYFTFDQAMDALKMTCDAQTLNARMEQNQSIHPERLKLERVTEANAESYIRTFNPAFFEMPMGATYDSSDIARILTADDQEAYLLILDGTPAGILEWIWEADRLCLEGIGILPEYRKQGLAAEAMHLTAQEAIKRSRSTVELVAMTNNEPAYSWYCRLGFQTETCYSHWFGTSDHKLAQEETEDMEE